MCYLEARYERQVDASGKDLVRACFLSYDPEAKYRLP
ncbi:protein containing VirE [gut metagenome]|uniref:Protein containing VirE n=1 Tax=gut metagenome TaxID=749906 RepID=J9GNW7_9ZZZZ